MKRIAACLLTILLCLACPAWAEDVFLPDGAEIERTETSYRSQHIAIDITAMRIEHSDVYIADIRVKDVTSFRRAFGGGAWKTQSQKVRELAEENGAILAMTGDNAHLLASGWVVGNGEALRDTANTQRDICLLYRNGEMRAIPAQNVEPDQLTADMEELWQVFCFGPSLLDAEGRAQTTFNSDVNPANPRSVIGYYEPGHYCFVQVDGRGTASVLEPRRTSRGLTLQRLSALMEELGCAAAYNLDGGQSSLMWFGGSVLSSPYKGGRRVGDIVLIAEPVP